MKGSTPHSLNLQNRNLIISYKTASFLLGVTILQEILPAYSKPLRQYVDKVDKVDVILNYRKKRVSKSILIQRKSSFRIFNLFWGNYLVFEKENKANLRIGELNQKTNWFIKNYLSEITGTFIFNKTKKTFVLVYSNWKYSK